jgi:hypothetical protein
MLLLICYLNSDKPIENNSSAFTTSCPSRDAYPLNILRNISNTRSGNPLLQSSLAVVAKEGILAGAEQIMVAGDRVREVVSPLSNLNLIL